MSKLTPMMEQYFEIKNQYSHCLLFFRLGDFYELFFDDALLASKELEITLTGRDCGQEEKAPMCGVPYHSVDGYIARLIEKGYKVAICEQLEDPKSAKGIVKRDVVRIITPGTILDTNALDENKNNYIMCIYEDKNGFGISLADISTGEFFTASFNKDDDKKVIDEIAKYNPSEIISNGGFNNSQIVENIFNKKVGIHSPWAFDLMNATRRLTGHYGIMSPSSFGLDENEPGICAAGALLDYLYDTQKNSLCHIKPLKKYTSSQYMLMDISSRRNLELTESIRDKKKKNTLLWVLDMTKTSMGARLIRQWLENPLLNSGEIKKRLDGVEELKNEVLFREELKELLKTVHDVERILSRLAYSSTNCRDLASLKNSLRHFPDIKSILLNCRSELFTEAVKGFDELTDIYKLIDEAIVDEPPFSIREGGFIKEGYSADLDTFIQAKNKGEEWLAELESRERQATGIKNLRIKYNKIFGYCIEVTNSYKALVPDRFIRRQTLSNCERYTTEELKEIEDAITGADEKQVGLEYELFIELLAKINAETARIQLSAYIVAVTDVIQSLAEAADRNNYCKPEINNNGIINIIDGRHPVVELMSSDGFVPNNTYLDTEDNRMSIITGPNMAGKSTYMRQVALIVLMAQIGSFIPAKSAEIGIVDRIFTRVGAADDLATGQSTFMVEMTEVANILNNATKDSLIILDEIGRGTSTFDGLSIAWSVLEHIADKQKLGAKTLFATHYHEMTELEGKVPGVNNYCISVMEKGDDVIFLRKIKRGGADHSYGIHVARLAGLPVDVLKRSTDILAALNNADIAKKFRHNDEHEEVFYGTKKTDDNRHNMVMHEILSLDIDSMSPRDALRTLYDMKKKTEELEGKY